MNDLALPGQFTEFVAGSGSYDSDRKVDARDCKLVFGRHVVVMRDKHRVSPRTKRRDNSGIVCANQVSVFQRNRLLATPSQLTGESGPTCLHREP